jgi:hypothetical protein
MSAASQKDGAAGHGANPPGVPRGLDLQPVEAAAHRMQLFLIISEFRIRGMLHGQREAVTSCTKKHQESRQSCAKKAHDCPSAEIHPHRPRKTGIQDAPPCQPVK